MDIRLSPYGQASAQPAPVNKMMAEFAEDFRDHMDINLGVACVNVSTISTTSIGATFKTIQENPRAYNPRTEYTIS